MSGPRQPSILAIEAFLESYHSSKASTAAFRPPFTCNG